MVLFVDTTSPLGPWMCTTSGPYSEELTMSALVTCTADETPDDDLAAGDRSWKALGANVAGMCDDPS